MKLTWKDYLFANFVAFIAAIIHAEGYYTVFYLCIITLLMEKQRGE